MNPKVQFTVNLSQAIVSRRKNICQISEVKFRLLFVICLFAASPLWAQIFITPNFSGSTQYDGWDGLNSTNYPQGTSGSPIYGGPFPGNKAWVGPIGSNTTLSGDAGFIKIAFPSGTMSNGMPSAGFIYTPSFSLTDFSQPVGRFRVSDTTAVAGLETAYFQIKIGYAEGAGAGLFGILGGTTPTLTYFYDGPGGQQSASLSVFDYDLLSSGTFVDPDFGPGTADVWGFQWDFRSAGVDVTGFEITFQTTNHAQIYGMELDQSDTFQAVPEPGSCLLLGLGTAVLFLRNRRSRRV